MINTTDKKAFRETLKSCARAAWFAFLGLLVAVFATLVTSGSIDNKFIVVGGMTVNLSVVILAVIGFLAKAIDQFIHKNENIAAKGIAPPFLQQ